MTFVSTDINWGLFRILMHIDVVYLILSYTITRNVRHFTYMMSTDMLTCR